MIPGKIKDLYNSLNSTISTFKSPAFRSYFQRRAEEDYNEISDRIKNNAGQREIQRYVDEQANLLDVLKRQTVIYNMFYDKTSSI